MHAGAEHQADDRLWLIAGTGEGPPLAEALLARGWRLRVCVVGSAAARAYPTSAGLEIAVGALGDAAAVGAALQRATDAAERPRWVVDASHPFATRISAALAVACKERSQPLLRLRRPLLAPGRATVLSSLDELRGRPLRGRALLLAIGARQLARAMACTPGALHHARILPTPVALAAAMAAGLPAERVAPLRPGGGDEASIERALCRRWGIAAVLCRRSGSPVEARWHRLAADEGLDLLLLDRPPEPAGVPLLGLKDLLTAIGHPGGDRHGPRESPRFDRPER